MSNHTSFRLLRRKCKDKNKKFVESDLESEDQSQQSNENKPEEENETPKAQEHEEHEITHKILKSEDLRERQSEYQSVIFSEARNERASFNEVEQEKRLEIETEKEGCSVASSRFLTPKKATSMNKTPGKQEATKAIKSPINTFEQNMYNEDVINDESIKDSMSQTPEKDQQLILPESQKEVSTYTNYEQRSDRKKKSKKFCGKKNKLENRRNKHSQKLSLHERLAHSIYKSESGAGDNKFMI